MRDEHVYAIYDDIIFVIELRRYAMPPARELCRVATPQRPTDDHHSERALIPF